MAAANFGIDSCIYTLPHSFGDQNPAMGMMTTILKTRSLQSLTHLSTSYCLRLLVSVEAILGLHALHQSNVFLLGLLGRRSLVNYLLPGVLLCLALVHCLSDQRWGRGRTG